MRSIGIVASIVLLAGVAHADDKLLVLKAEGRADKAARMKIEARVLEMAKAAGDPTAGDITFGDAAAMVGCKPDEDKCKDEVIGMLSVDEIVTITTTPKPGGVIEVNVRRITKGGATKTATAMVVGDKAEQLEPIAPLFAKGGPASPLPPPVPATNVTPAPPVREQPKPAPPPMTAPAPKPAPPVAPSTQVAQSTSPSPMQEQPHDVDEGRPRGNRRLAAIGMIGGGAMVVTGMIFWGAAAGVEEDIKDAPKRTREDLENLQDLEAKGDGYATAGNVLFVGGLILGGVSTYFFLKSGKSSSRSAHIVPAAHAGGGGIAIIGGF